VIGDDLDRWIATGDLDELLREVERCCDRGRDGDASAWDDLEVLRRRARGAIDRGHQLWPAASWAEFRLALQAPAPRAAAVVREGAGYLGPGPLTEVVAQHHTWQELAPHLADGPARDLVAQERVLRGEDLTGPGGHAHPDLPGRLLAWEPSYALAEYRPDVSRFPAPDLPGPSSTASGRHRDPCAEAVDGARALEDAVRHWSSHSNGSVRAVGVEGTAADALVSLAGDRCRWVPVSAADAAALLGWAAASGGARGRRRGAATGRFEVWWALAVLGGVEDRWPVDPGPAAEELRWYRWAPDGPELGWSCRLAVEDPVDGLAWALDASDRD
jgi:hypothetical protein